MLDQAAAVSSDLGSEVSLVVGTLDLAITIIQWMVLYPSTSLACNI